jgi:meiotically up-regulated gene 157 (Mug157) protein
VQWLNLCKQRNQELHGATAAAMQSSARRSVYYELGKLYDQRAALDTGTQQLLMHSESAHRQKPIWATRNWLSAHNQIFRENMRKTRQKAIAGVRNIQSYFSPVR